MDLEKIIKIKVLEITNIEHMLLTICHVLINKNIYFYNFCMNKNLSIYQKNLVFIKMQTIRILIIDNTYPEKHLTRNFAQSLLDK